MNIYGLKDRACGIVHVFTANNEIAAKRAIAEAMERGPGELIYRYAEDFDLLKLSEIDSNSGQITDTNIKFVANLSELKRKENNHE